MYVVFTKKMKEHFLAKKLRIAILFVRNAALQQNTCMVDVSSFEGRVNDLKCLLQPKYAQLKKRSFFLTLHSTVYIII